MYQFNSIMRNTSETDWDMIDSLTDETIDRTEFPPLDDSFFARAKWRMPEKSADVIRQFIQTSDLLAGRVNMSNV